MSTGIDGHIAHNIQGQGGGGSGGQVITSIGATVASELPSCRRRCVCMTRKSQPCARGFVHGHVREAGGGSGKLVDLKQQFVDKAQNEASKHTTPTPTAPWRSGGGG